MYIKCGDMPMPVLYSIVCLRLMTRTSNVDIHDFRMRREWEPGAGCFDIPSNEVVWDYA